MAEAPAKEPQVKYDYPGHATDDANIKKVEDALASRFPDSYKEGLANSAKDAPVKEEEAKGKIDKAHQDAASEEKSNPDKVAKERQESPPPPATIAPPKQEVQAHNPTTSGPKAPQAGGSPNLGAKPAGPVAAPHPAAAPAAAPGMPQALILKAAGSGDGQIDGVLDGYEHKSAEPTERVSKIKEMAEVAKGFDGKVDGYISTSGGALDQALGSSKDFIFGKKELAGLSATENPYNKVNDSLKSTMVGVSRVQSFVSIVGNVCQKLGLVLTILGLFGFIFPPIGAAIQAVARILNLVGIICDVIGMVLSGVLVGLNGVALARQIGKGASNEEKAALADHMMGEANAAGGHIMNLALAYGGKFMSGFKNASKGVLGNLFKKFKGVVGKFASRTLGPAASWAKNIGYKLGIGLEKEPGMLSKAGGWAKENIWNGPGKLLDKAKEANWVKKVNASATAQSLERGAGHVNNHWLTNLDGAGLEGVGEAAGSKVFTKNAEKRMEASAQLESKEAFDAAQKNAVKDAGNKERAQIEKSIKEQQANGNKLYEQSTAGENLDEGKAVASREAYENADKLAKGEDKAVADAEKKAAKDGDKEWDKKQEEQQDKKDEARREEINKEKWQEDPKKFQEATARMERDLKDKERLANSKVAKPSRREAAKEEAEKLREKIEERKVVGMKAGGLELEKPKNLWDVGKKAVYDPIHEYKEEKEKEEGRDKYAEEDKSWTWGATVRAGSGGHGDYERAEAAERAEKIEKWEEKRHENPGTSEHVETMLIGLDDELGLAPAADAPDAAPVDAKDETPDAAPAPSSPTPDAAPNGAPTNPVVAAAEPPKPTSDEAKSEKPADAAVPELAYWPHLTQANGEFASAAVQLGQMKLTAFGFRKAQVEARKKASEAAMAFNAQGVDMTKKQQAAGEQGKALQEGVQDQQNNANAADKSGSKAGEGSAQQSKGQGQAGAPAQPGPDAGEKPGILHPIKRIWWYVKSWVSEKAAAVFGWIQEKIASMVLKVVCGISMDDLKGYTTALHHRMEYSKLVGSQGKATADETMKKSMEEQGKAKSYEQQALDDAKECDQNIADADNFVKEVEQTEKDLAEEQARATAFLASIHAAVQAEKARVAQEKQQKLAAQQQGPAGAQGAAPAPAIPKPPVSTDPKNPKGQAQPAQPKPINPAAVGKVKNAASYVVGQTNQVLVQLAASKNEQLAKLNATVGDKAKKINFNTSNVGDKVIADAKSASAEIADAMRAISNQTPANAGDVQREAGSVKGKARQIDEIAHAANEQLNETFKNTYEAISNPKSANG